MAEESGSIGDFFVKLFFKVDESSEHEAHGALHGLQEKFHELAKEAFAFNEIREAIEHIVEPIKEMWEGVEKVAETGHHLETFSETMGISVESLQRFGFYAQSVGVSAETMQHSMMSLSRQMGEAASGEGKEISAAFQKLGVSVRGADGAIRNVGEVMPELLEKFSALETPAERASLAMKVFGRGGIELLPLLSAESEKLKELNGDFLALGGSFSEELLERSHAFIEVTNKSTFALGNMKRELATGIMPAFTSFVNLWLDFVRGSWPEISSALRGIGETLGDVFMKTAGTAFDTFLKFVKDLSKNSEALDTVATALKAIGVVLLVYFAATAPGMVGIALLAGFIEDFTGAMEGKDSLVGRFALGLESLGKQAGFLGASIRALSRIWSDFKAGLMWAGTGFSSDPEVKRAIHEASEEGSTMSDLAFQQRHIDIDKELEGITDPRERAAAWRRMVAPQFSGGDDMLSGAPSLVPLKSATPAVVHNNTMTFHVQARDPKEAAHEIRKIVKDHHDTTTSEAMRDLATEGP